MSLMNLIRQCFMIYVVLVVRYGFSFLILYSLVQKCQPVVLGSKTVCWKELKVVVDTLGATVTLLLTLVEMQPSTLPFLTAVSSARYVRRDRLCLNPIHSPLISLTLCFEMIWKLTSEADALGNPMCEETILHIPVPSGSSMECLRLFEGICESPEQTVPKSAFSAKMLYVHILTCSYFCASVESPSYLLTQLYCSQQVCKWQLFQGSSVGLANDIHFYNLLPLKYLPC